MTMSQAMIVVLLSIIIAMQCMISLSRDHTCERQFSECTVGWEKSNKNLEDCVSALTQYADTMKSMTRAKQ